MKIEIFKNSLKAMKDAMACLTGEDEDQWRESQSWDESPYWFLYKSIIEVEGEIAHE